MFASFSQLQVLTIVHFEEPVLQLTLYVALVNKLGGQTDVNSLDSLFDSLEHFGGGSVKLKPLCIEDE